MSAEYVLTISSVKRVNGRAALTLSNGDVLFMPRAMLREHPYRSGMPFDRAQFDAFLRERAYPFALEKAIALLAARARTEKEIFDSLRRNAYPETAVARVMARLQESGYINDADFAERWAHSRASRGLGGRRIRMELRAKGVDSAEIDHALSSMDENDLLDAAVQAAAKLARGKDLSSPADRRKVLAALARRGYDFSLAKQALQQCMDQS